MFENKASFSSRIKLSHTSNIIFFLRYKLLKQSMMVRLYFFLYITLDKSIMLQIYIISIDVLVFFFVFFFFFIKTQGDL
jgi:hypothetical protein